MPYSRCPQPTDTHKTAIGSTVSIAKEREKLLSKRCPTSNTSESEIRAWVWQFQFQDSCEFRI